MMILTARLLPKEEYWGYVLVRTQKGKTKEAIASMESIFTRFNPNFPFKYQFADEEFANIYSSENTVSSLANYFAILAIFISCLGLFGLAAFTAERRQKEIGIRKVNGATITQVLTLLNKDFVKWVGIAFLIALPISWYAMNQWLAGFAYKTALSWWVFALAALLGVVVAIVTVSYQSIKAAIVNPVKSLRTE